MAEPSAPTRGVREIENTWIPLSDGTRLAARIWMPEDALQEPVPAVLEYLPYRKSDGTALADLGRHPYFAEHGYAAVRVDLRGTGDSDGLLRGEYLPQEQEDALEVLAWLERQPWCTGAAGMIGYSWGGFNGLQIAAHRPRQLKAVITIASTDDRYLDDCHYMGGCLLGSDMLKWSASMLTYALQPPDPRHAGAEWREKWLERLQNAPELAHDWISHQLRDSFWKHGSVAEDYSSIECPVMVVGGWADAYTNSVPRLIEHLEVPRLGLIGPWGHMMPHEGVPGPAIGFLREAVRWWDTWLKGVDTGVMDEPLLRVWMQDYVPPARFYDSRPGRWISENTWPPSEATPVHLRLQGGGDLSLEGGAQAPVAAAGTQGSPARVRIRGMQECGETAGVWCANGFADEMPADQDPDDRLSLCFTTGPLDDPLEVLGHPKVRLRLSSDRPRALVAARLEDVAPDGSSLLVSWGMLNLTHREGHGRARPLEPGREYEVQVECRVCGHRFEGGHRIRLALSPTYWPHAWPSPRPASLEIAIDGPSVLLLPVRQAAPSSPLGPPEKSGPRDAERHDERSRLIRVDPEIRRHEIIDSERHEQIVPGSGAIYSEVATDVYSIVEDDPLSATVRCVRETSSVGGAASWRVSLASEMTCDVDSFRVREDYAVFEGDTRIYANTRGYTIPREGV